MSAAPPDNDPAHDHDDQAHDSARDDQAASHDPARDDQAASHDHDDPARDPARDDQAASHDPAHDPARDDPDRLLRVVWPAPGFTGEAHTAGDLRELRLIRDRSVSPPADIQRAVRDIIDAVRDRGDDAVRAYAVRFDRREPGPGGSYEISRDAWRDRAASVTEPVRAALTDAAARIRAFHAHQVVPGYATDAGGVRLGMRVAPLSRVGIYVPGGTARYPSSVLMTAIPAHVAGVREIVMVTPGASPETLAAADIAGVHRVFELGGAHAVAALAYGTATIPRVDKIVGPGNQWVAEAKRQVFGAVDIDAVAGPSEVLILADADADPRWIAADLLAQAEHDVEARPILVTTEPSLPDAVDAELLRQLATLPRADIARRSLRSHGVAVVASSLAEAIAVANEYAPEHLELHVRDPRAVADQLHTAGAIFVGPHAPEAAGDYTAGANHVLPTGGTARYASPLGVYDFVKRTSIIEYTADALRDQAPAIAALAHVEGLHAHARSVLIRAGDDE